MSSRGRRYNGDKKLNMKKVFAVIIAILIIIMLVIEGTKLLKKKPNTEEKTVVNKYFAVYDSNKWGVINSKGEIVIKPEYDETIIIPNCTRDVFICTYDVDYTNNTYKTKVINNKNEIIIEGYDQIIPLENYDLNNNLWFENDILAVKKDEKYGLIDFRGRELLKCEYDQIQTLKGNEKSILIKKDNQYGLVDNIGMIIIEPEYKEIQSISDKYEDGYIVVTNDDKYGVIARNKSVVIEPKYQQIAKIKGNDNYVVKENDKWKIIDKLGNTYLEDKFEQVVSINGVNVIVKNKDKYSVMNLAGEIKLPEEYQEIVYAFDNNYIVKKDNKYGIINIDGQELVNIEYDSLIYRTELGFFEAEKTEQQDTIFIGNDFNKKIEGILSDVNIDLGYIKVRINGEHKYYNLKFEEKTNKELLTMNTIFLDKKDGKYGFVNKEGIVVVDYIYDDATEQNEFGYASVKKGGLWGCINSKGKEIITPTYELKNARVVNFINTWHKGEDLNLNYYTN